MYNLYVRVYICIYPHINYTYYKLFELNKYFLFLRMHRIFGKSDIRHYPKLSGIFLLFGKICRISLISSNICD